MLSLFKGVGALLRAALWLVFAILKTHSLSNGVCLFRDYLWCFLNGWSFKEGAHFKWSFLFKMCVFQLGGLVFERGSLFKGGECVVNGNSLVCFWNFDKKPHLKNGVCLFKDSLWFVFEWLFL